MKSYSHVHTNCELGRCSHLLHIDIYWHKTWSVCLDWLLNVPWLQVGEQGPGPGGGHPGAAADLILLPPGRWRDPRPLQHLPAWLPNVRILFSVQGAKTKCWLTIFSWIWSNNDKIYRTVNRLRIFVSSCHHVINLLFSIWATKGQTNGLTRLKT